MNLRSSQWPLTARDEQLADFDAAWGTCRGLVVSGPAGVGKTRLAEEFLARAVRSGFRGGRATATAAAAEMPLAAIAHLIPPGVDLSDPVAGFTAVARRLAGPGRDRRWALLVDDLHLLDSASVVLLRQLTDAGVVRLLGTLRTGQPLGAAVVALCGDPSVRRVDVGAFTPQQTDAVLQQALGAPAARRTSFELHRVSGGNVLFLRELVEGASAAGRLTFDGELWSLTDGEPQATSRLTELVDARLGAVPEQGRAVLELLALCAPVPLADAQALAPLPVLADLEAAGLVRTTTDRRRTEVCLAHPLYGELLRAGLAPLRRRHHLLAQIERTTAGGARRRDDRRRLAAWQLAATGTADPALLLEAASLARYAHDYPLAARLLRAAEAEGRQSVTTRHLLGEVLFELGDTVEAEAVLADADAAAVSESDVVAVAISRTMNLFWAAGRTDDALAVIARAQARVTGEPWLRMLRYSEAAVRIPAGQPEHGLALLDDLHPELDAHPDLDPSAELRPAADARPGPDGGADPAPWLAGAMMKVAGLDLTGRSAEAAAFAEAVHRSHERLDQRSLYPHPASQLIGLSASLRGLGRLAESREVGERAFKQLTEADISVPAIWLAINLGLTEWLAGRPATARRWYAEAAARARTQRSANALHAALHGIAACVAVLGDGAAARRLLAEADAGTGLPLYRDTAYLARAWTAAAGGDLDGARRVLRVGAAEAAAAGIRTTESLLLTETARLGGAREVVERLRELAPSCQGAWPAARLSLATALACDEPDQLLAAAVELQTLGADLTAAEAANSASVALRRAGRTRAATAAARQAASWAAHCEGARTPLLLPAETTTALSGRQREIALLAANGATNKRIAGMLSLSVRTVENQLQRAYVTLGIAGRQELPAALGVSGVTSAGRQPE
ncbi:helix-turn-helix transcriptional regulator [Streptacidiphilus jiangxiensis]|uniref:ATP-, maltotriose-and DNA-dependent transcriptional regulator MalT n=1 Tax=Streptacidiphilus jiangxiensis TaxID=235985 RepID=A0A1H7T0N6_STRJI|nr:LuxR family transcriptional regulator [Streptacidiphilus jiangxiensis]SEL78431.1 ATP-, maltotriose-and DNA-dependent transcriptional regulator MalT [Streptacidiphilus jiangxiensis]